MHASMCGRQVLPVSLNPKEPSFVRIPNLRQACWHAHMKVALTYLLTRPHTRTAHLHRANDALEHSFTSGKVPLSIPPPPTSIPDPVTANNFSSSPQGSGRSDHSRDESTIQSRNWNERSSSQKGIPSHGRTWDESERSSTEAGLSEQHVAWLLTLAPRLRPVLVQLCSEGALGVGSSGSGCGTAAAPGRVSHQGVEPATSVSHQSVGPATGSGGRHGDGRGFPPATGLSGGGGGGGSAPSTSMRNGKVASANSSSAHERSAHTAHGAHATHSAHSAHPAHGVHTTHSWHSPTQQHRPASTQSKPAKRATPKGGVPPQLRQAWVALGAAADFCQRCHKAERARAGGMSTAGAMSAAAGASVASVGGAAAVVPSISMASAAPAPAAAAPPAVPGVNGGAGTGARGAGSGCGAQQSQGQHSYSLQLWFSLLEEFVGRMRGAARQRQSIQQASAGSNFGLSLPAAPGAQLPGHNGVPTATAHAQLHVQVS